MRLRFGPFTIDSETRQLVRGRSDLHLSPKAFDLLWTLVEQRPKVLDKTTLQSRIWPDTYVVEANLNVLIGEIRRVLADSAREPRFIRTVHGIGYAFCGDASAVGEEPASARTPCWVIAQDQTFRLSEGENIVGRDPACAVWLDSDSVSRRHARIVVESGDRRVSLEDLASKNGTRVRGAAVRDRVNLSDGDEIVFGAIRARLRSWSSGTDAETKRIRRTKN
ncbi:MAG TPA: FHA domain-containing protein [Vicinamibacterales bacterium]